MLANPPARAHIAAVANPPSLAALELQTRDYDAECVRMEELVAALEADMEAIKRKHLPALKRQAGVVANRQADLQSAIETATELFTKPRTLTLNGIKIGFTNSVGSIVWDDDDQVVSLIKKQRPEDAATLVRTFTEPNKNALKSLPPAELKKLGCRVEGAGDVVVLKRVAGDVEKLVTNLIDKMVAAMTKEKDATA